MKKKRIKFSEGGDMPDIPREPLRDSSGRKVRDSSGEEIMSGSTEMRQGRQFPKMFDAYEDYVNSPAYKEDIELGKRMRAERDAAEEESKKPAEVKPVRAPDLPKQLKTEDTDEADRRREEISKLPQKEKPKPVKKKTKESKPPAGAFRGTRSEGANTLPSAFRGAGARGTGTNLLSPEAKMRDINRKKREIVSRDFNRLKDDAGLNFAKGGKVGSASKRGDGIAQRGKTRGKMY